MDRPLSKNLVALSKPTLKFYHADPFVATALHNLCVLAYCEIVSAQTEYNLIGGLMHSVATSYLKRDLDDLSLMAQ